jgi:adenosylcobinamide kinase / adenosylcobinamide-phosphate guanylyltransferase
LSKVTLLTGGCRSGKSRKALEVASAFTHKAFIATAEPIDEEMDARIAAHRRERGDGFITVEEPVDLAGAIRALPDRIEVAIVDCLTVWLGNLMYRVQDLGEREAFVSEFIDALKAPPCDIVIVTNEVGMGIVPSDALSREYRDLAGGLNQKVAVAAGRVIFMVSGLPIVLKDTVE